MGELIDREKLLKALKNIPNIYSMDIHCDEYYGEGVQRAIEEAVKVPIVDAVPVVHGKWKPIKASIYPYGFDVRCSECGCAILGGVNGWNYCPNCGAKMDGEKT